MWALLIAISFLVFVGSMVGLLFKRARAKAKRYAWISALAMIVGIAVVSSKQDEEARRLGFVDDQDRRAATEAGIKDPVAWRDAKEAQKGGLVDPDAPALSGKAGSPTVAANADTAASNQPTYAGRVMPFSVIRAIRNYGFKDGLLPAQVSIGVEGGTPADWMATAVYVAEKSIINDVTYSEVEVYVPTPWADFPPTHSKMIAKAYYAGPDPRKSPWPNEQWTIHSASRAATLPEIEFDELTNTLIEKLSSRIHDPDLLGRKADEEARKLLIQKYGLARNWQPSDNGGLNGPHASRTQIGIASTEGVEASMAALRKCLSTSGTAALFRGCMPERKDYVFVASTTSPSNWPPQDPGQYVTKVDFTLAWAKKLKGLKTLADLQRVAGSKGTISERKLDGDHPSVSFHWRSEPSGSRVGYMLATVYEDGGIGVSVLTDENASVIVNNFGAFICEKCNPPIDIRGEEPSWSK